MAFKYKYEKILSLRREEEENKKQKLAAKIADLGRIKQKLEEIIQKKEGYELSQGEKLKSGTSAEEVWRYASGKKWFKEEVEHIEEMRRFAERAVSQARMELTLATKEVKKFEKLKEKALNEYRAKELRDFNEMIDGVMNFKEARKDKA